MLGNRSWEEWIHQYSASHQHPVNRACHTLGIPMIVISLLLIPLAVWRNGWWWLPAGLFVVGWAFQFAGHVFEGKPPEFFKDWRFLFVGLRWWFAKMAGKA
ncbi:MAG TPA: DUF962 domain-containing protein [Bryobacteraceae bacterium]|nr:DUF962 domain-containing protein [Bryobacteraceae bacterium]